MKKYLIGLLALMTAVSVNAAVLSASYAAGVSNIVATPAKLNSLTLIAPTNSIVRLYDTTYSTLLSTNTAYTNMTYYVTNQITTYVTSTGLTNSFTNSVLYSALTTVAAATNNTSPIAILVAPANVVVSLPNLGYTFMRGLTMSNDVALSIIWNYDIP